ncbi:MAG: SMODS domain-containing nucleotidyltransferase [Thermoleophilia bacterium]
MKENEYLKKILEDQVLSSDEIKELKNHRDDVESCIRKEVGEDPTIKYAGSKAKATMIRECYDLDIICYFPDTDDRTLKDIYHDIKNILKDKYSVETKTSVIRINGIKDSDDAYHIDVVPGRYIDENKDDAFLYISNSNGDRIQTNIDVHISTIKNSGCQEVIKLAKLWKVRNRLDFRTFILELAVVRALDGFKDKDNLDKAMRVVLGFFKDDFVGCRLIDPANTNNIVSDLISKAKKEALATAAGQALDGLDDADGDEGWKEIFKDENKKESKVFYPLATSSPPRPWCE